jgi:hypothetical protein
MLFLRLANFAHKIFLGKALVLVDLLLELITLLDLIEDTNLLDLFVDECVEVVPFQMVHQLGGAVACRRNILSNQRFDLIPVPSVIPKDLAL